MQAEITIHDVEQGTEAWKELRLGRVTASKFKDMMTNGRGKDTMGQTAYTYMYDLIAETLTEQSQDEIKAKAIDWGNEHEPTARAMYCLAKDCRVQQVGFVTSTRKERFYRHVGVSPDGFVGDDGGVEIKCPMSSRIHLGYIEKGGVPKDYYWQVQGLMWITGRPWWDFVSYDPRMPEHLKLYVHREQADKDAHEDLAERAERFVEQMLLKLERISSNAA